SPRTCSATSSSGGKRGADTPPTAAAPPPSSPSPSAPPPAHAPHHTATPPANTGIGTRRFASRNRGRFQTGANGLRFPPSHDPAISVTRRRRDGAAARSRVFIDWLVQRDDGTPPRLSVVSGNTDTSTGVTASYPHSATSSQVRSASSSVTCGVNGGAFS